MKIKFLLIIFFLIQPFFQSCAWDSDNGWQVIEKEEPVKTNNIAFYECAGENIFGNFSPGGGCNVFGCWIEGGSCNEFGCAVSGTCTYNGCEKPTASIICQKK